MRPMKRLLIIYSITLCVISLNAQQLDSNLKRGFDSISPLDVYGYCKTLSSPAFKGRFTGHEGFTSAAKWAAGMFKRWGIKPLFKEYGYLQPFPAPYSLIDSAEMFVTLVHENKETEIELIAGEDFLPLLFSDSGDNTAGIVFVGWGISAPELGYDDYAGIDVNGKFVLCFRGVPDRSDPAFKRHDEHRQRMKVAKSKGALGLFYIYDEPLANPNGERIEGFTPAIISSKTADVLLNEKRVTSLELKKDLQTYKRPISFELSPVIRYRVSGRYFPEGTGYNVGGYIEGSDPELRKECVVFGGHLDHCGPHMNMIFAGANDNASGSATVLEIAEAFSKTKHRPKRSVVFLLFGGEEMGLLGSDYFVDHIPKQFKRIDAMFNFDMTGEGEGVSCGYSSNSPYLKELLLDADRFVKILRATREIKRIGVRSSDYAPFFLKGASCVYFVSNGPHLYYHKTGDTIFRINPDIMSHIARLAFITGFKWADR